MFSRLHAALLLCLVGCDDGPQQQPQPEPLPPGDLWEPCGEGLSCVNGLSCWKTGKTGGPWFDACAPSCTFDMECEGLGDGVRCVVEEQPKVLVQDWYKDAQTQTRVRSEISRVLNNDLPESYDRALFEQKCAKVYELATEYAAKGRKWAT